MFAQTRKGKKGDKLQPVSEAVRKPASMATGMNFSNKTLHAKLFLVAEMVAGYGLCDLSYGCSHGDPLWQVSLCGQHCVV